jgi:cob(I)alamin adenosyltransferase
VLAEAQVELVSALVTLPRDFIVPGDSPAGAALALARTIVRRAERQVAGLVHSKVVENLELLRYLNRLSSLCFVELSENQRGKTTPTLARVTNRPVQRSARPAYFIKPGVQKRRLQKHWGAFQPSQR